MKDKKWLAEQIRLDFIREHIEAEIEPEFGLLERLISKKEGVMMQLAELSSYSLSEETGHPADKDYKRIIRIVEGLGKMEKKKDLKGNEYVDVTDLFIALKEYELNQYPGIKVKAVKSVSCNTPRLTIYQTGVTIETRNEREG